MLLSMSSVTNLSLLFGFCAACMVMVSKEEIEGSARTRISLFSQKCEAECTIIVLYVHVCVCVCSCACVCACV